MKLIAVNPVYIIMAIVALAYADVSGADWRVVGVSDTYQYYYNADSITHLPENIVRVWNRAVFNQKGVDELVKELGSRYQEASTSVEVYEFNCLDKKARPISLSYYSKEETLLGSSNTGTLQIQMDWAPIASGTAIELVYRAVCK